MTKAEKKTWFIELKSKPCTDCGDLFPDYCMDWDHVPGRGDKRFGVNMDNATKRSQEEVLIELAKCDLVCAICHRIRTHQRGYPKKSEHYFKDECIHGHDLTDPNNWRKEGKGRKGCSECVRIRNWARYNKLSNLGFEEMQEAYNQKNPNIGRKRVNQ